MTTKNKPKRPTSHLTQFGSSESQKCEQYVYYILFDILDSSERKLNPNKATKVYFRSDCIVGCINLPLYLK